MERLGEQTNLGTVAKEAGGGGFERKQLWSLEVCWNSMDY